MRIRDWSSGVCSSDLGPVSIGFHLALELGLDRQRQVEAPADPLVLAARKIDRAGIDADQFTRAVADESVGERRFARRRSCGETRDIVVGDRKRTRLTPVTNTHLVCRLLLATKTTK